MPRTLEAQDTANYFSEFALLLIPPCGSDRTMAVLAAYLDDSGTHKASPLCVVAGGVASVQQWIKLAKEWQRYLGLLGIEIFRMADFVSGYPPYDGWSKDKKRTVLLKLVGIMREHVRYLVGGAARAEDFAKAFQKFPNPGIADAYHFCASMIMPAIGEWAARSEKRSPVALIYEKGNNLLNEWFREAQRDFRNEAAREAYRIGTITTANKRDANPLQAADVIAYGIFKCKTQSAIEPYLAEAYGQLWRIKNAGYIYTQEMIEGALKGVARDYEKRQKPASAAGGTL